MHKIINTPYELTAAFLEIPFIKNISSSVKTIFTLFGTGR